MLIKFRNMRLSDKEQGFTLIELLVVIVIIGILAAIALPIFLNQQKAAIAASVKSDVRNTVGNVALMLTKTPSATDVSTATVVRSGTNIIGVAGAWNTYTVKGKNPDVANWCFVYTSTTGKYTEETSCSFTGTGGTEPPSLSSPLFPSNGSYSSGNSTSYTAGTTPMGQAMDIAIDSTGRILVAEDSANRVAIYNPTTSSRTSLAGLPNRVTSIEIDGSGNVVALTQPGGIYKITPAGVVTTVTNAFTATAGMYAYDIALASDGSYFVGDYTGGGIWKVTAAGVGTKIYDTGGAVSGVAVGPDGKVYFANFSAGTIRRVSDTGTGAENVVAYSGFDVWKIKFDSAGALFVAGYNANNIKKVNVTAKTSAVAVTTGTGSAVTIAIGSAGKLYVSKYDGTITVYN